MRTRRRTTSCPSRNTGSLPANTQASGLRTRRHHEARTWAQTWTDYKTVFFPIVRPVCLTHSQHELNGLRTVFACATAPARSCSDLFWCCVWVWFHQLMCNVSNQVCGLKEDKTNHPWRPFLSGRVSGSQAPAIRWATVALCVSLSSMYDPGPVHTTLCLVAVTFAHDELGGEDTVVGKDLFTAAAYVCFKVGATTIIGTSCRYYIYVQKQPGFFALASQALIDNPQVLWISYLSPPSSSVGPSSFTSVHAQDFPDVEGDKTVGRMTFPIYAPELSRFFTLFITTA